MRKWTPIQIVFSKEDCNDISYLTCASRTSLFLYQEVRSISLPRMDLCNRFNPWRTAEVTQCDFWGQVIKMAWTSALFSWDACSWNPATMPQGRTSSPQRPHSPGLTLSQQPAPTRQPGEWATFKVNLPAPTWVYLPDTIWTRGAVLWALSKLQIHGESNGCWSFKLLSLEAISYTAENNWYRVPNPNPPSSVVFSEVSKTLSLPSISPAPFQVFLHEILQHLLLIIVSNHFIIINHHFPTIRRVI